MERRRGHSPPRPLQQPIDTEEEGLRVGEEDLGCGSPGRQCPESHEGSEMSNG